MAFASASAQVAFSARVRPAQRVAPVACASAAPPPAAKAERGGAYLKNGAVALALVAALAAPCCPPAMAALFGPSGAPTEIDDYVKNPSLIDSDNLKGGKASRLMPSITGTVATEDQESVKGQDKNPASPQKASTTKAIPDLPSKLS